MTKQTMYYDAGPLNDFGGGNVAWWQDYLRAEIGRANDHWSNQLNIVWKRLDAVLLKSGEIEDQKFDAILLQLGETQERMINAQMQLDKLVEALGRIAHPLWWMQEDQKKATGSTSGMNGDVALSLSQDADYLKLIATEALQYIKTNKPTTPTQPNPTNDI